MMIMVIFLLRSLGLSHGHCDRKQMSIQLKSKCEEKTQGLDIVSLKSLLSLTIQGAKVKNFEAWENNQV